MNFTRKPRVRAWEMVVCGGKVLAGWRICYYRIPDGYGKSRRNRMAEKVKVWFDPEGDFLEVRFSDLPGFMRETTHDALMERVDEQGQVVGFSILGVSRFRKERPFEAELTASK
jgi:hypothetical protein